MGGVGMTFTFSSVVIDSTSFAARPNSFLRSFSLDESIFQNSLLTAAAPASCGPAALSTWRCARDGLGAVAEFCEGELGWLAPAPTSGCWNAGCGVA